jgi:hypothetical protein
MSSQESLRSRLRYVINNPFASGDSIIHLKTENVGDKVFRVLIEKPE